MSTAVQNNTSVPSVTPGRNRAATATVAEEPFEKVLSTARQKDKSAQATARKAAPKSRGASKAEHASRGKSNDKAESAEKAPKPESTNADEVESPAGEAEPTPTDDIAEAALPKDKKTDPADEETDENAAAEAQAAAQTVLASAVTAIETSDGDAKEDSSQQPQQGAEQDQILARIGAATADGESTTKSGAPSDAPFGQAPKTAEITGKMASAAQGADLAIPAEKNEADSDRPAAIKLPDLPLPQTGEVSSSAVMAAVTKFADAVNTIEGDDDASATTQVQPAVNAPSHAAHGSAKPVAPAVPTAAAPETEFAQANHQNIVTGVRGHLLPGGGTMQIRLDPPELGALQVMVEMRDGTMTATFQTSNDMATQLLSHSLNQLKTVLEGQGINVERLQVQQAPKNDRSSANQEQQNGQQQNPDDHAAHQEQQRREMLRRMWRRISGAGDPIDYLA